MSIIFIIHSTPTAPNERGSDGRLRVAKHTHTMLNHFEKIGFPGPATVPWYSYLDFGVLLRHHIS